MKKYLSIFLLLYTSILFADHYFNFEHITTDKGLSNNTVYKIIQDKDGYIWITTKDGLNKYYGKKTEVFSHIPGEKGTIISSYFKNIYEDSFGSIWAATPFGLIRSNIFKKSFTNQTDPKDQIRMEGNYYLKIFKADDSNMWITVNSGLCKFDFKHNTFTNYILKKNIYIHYLYYDISKQLWIATNKGLYFFNKIKNEFSPFPMIKLIKGKLTSEYITYLSEDNLNNLLIGTSDGLYTYNRSSKELIHFHTDPENLNSLSDNYISKIFKNKKGDIFIGTGNGLNLYHPGSGTFKKFFSKISNNNFITRMYEDKNNIFWIMTRTNLNILDTTKNTIDIVKTRAGTSISGIRTILEDKSGVLWFGTSNNGVYKYSLFKNRFKVIDKLENKIDKFDYNNVTSIFKQEDILWIGTDNGLIKHKTRSNSYSLYNMNNKLTDAIKEFYLKNNITNREREIIELIINGKTNKDIEDELFISIKTVNNHKQNIYRKLNVNNNGDLKLLFRSL